MRRVESRVGKPPTLVGFGRRPRTSSASTSPPTTPMRRRGAQPRRRGQERRELGARRPHAATTPSTLVHELAGRAGRGRHPARCSASASAPPVSSTPPGRVLDAPNLGWHGMPLAERACGDGSACRSSWPTTPTPPRSASTRSATPRGGGLMVLRVGKGVGAGLILEGTLLHGHRVGGRRDRPRRGRRRAASSAPAAGSAASRRCSPYPGCGSGSPPTTRAHACSRRPDERLGAALAPVVGTLNLHELVLSGPIELLDGAAARRGRPSTIRARHHARHRRRARGAHVGPGGGRGARGRRRPRPGRGAGRVVTPTSVAARPREEQSECDEKNTLLAIARRRRPSALACACGDDDDGDDRRRRRARRRPTSGSGSTAPDTPQAARDWLKTTFEDAAPRLHAHHRGAGVGGAGRAADHGAVQRVRDARRGRGRATPRRRRSPTAGAFSDLTDELDDLGGDDLLQGFVDGGTYDGKTYAVPYYAGSKYVFYRKDLFEAAGIEVPTTHGRVRPGGDRPQGGQPDAGELLRLLVPRARTGATASRSSGTPVVTWPPRTATSGRARCRRPSRSRASRPCRR